MRRLPPRGNRPPRSGQVQAETRRDCVDQSIAEQPADRLPGIDLGLAGGAGHPGHGRHLLARAVLEEPGQRLQQVQFHPLAQGLALVLPPVRDLRSLTNGLT